jgi:hypothetical protein
MGPTHPPTGRTRPTRQRRTTQAAGELALFPTIRTPAAIASAEPLRATSTCAPTEPGHSVTLGQARRHTEILHALRIQRELAASSAPAQAAEHHANDSAAVSARMAAADRDRARHEQQLAQTRRSRLSLRL